MTAPQRAVVVPVSAHFTVAVRGATGNCSPQYTSALPDYVVFSANQQRWYKNL